MTKYLFLHHVKTAGKTVEKFLIRKFASQYCRTTSVFREETIDNIFSILASKDKGKLAAINKSKVISGHFPFGLHNSINDEARYFTLLRDPVARARSYYAYSLKNNGSRIHSYLHEHNITFEQFIQFEKEDIIKSGVHELNYVLEDGQAKVMAGIDLLVGDGSTNYLLDVCEKNIESHFDFVGVTELFNTSFIEISRLLGFGYFSLYITQNKSKVSVDVSPQAREIILERNPVDYSLHAKYYDKTLQKANEPMHRLANRYLSIGSFAANQYVNLRVK